MPRPVVKVVREDGQVLREGVGLIEEELGLPTAFSEEVERAARQAAGDPRLPSLDRSQSGQGWDAGAATAGPASAISKNSTRLMPAAAR